MLILHASHLPAPAQERGVAHAMQSAVARRLLREIADALHLPNAPIAVTDMGRPYFEGLSSVDFSLTHTNGFAACALQQRKSDPPPRLGIDAEVLTTFDNTKIAAFSLRFFGKHEQAYLESADDRPAAFTKIFVRKESYAKYVGDGLGKHLSATDTMHPDFEKAAGVRFYSYLKNGCFISLCVSCRCDEQPIWFKESSTNKQ